MEGKARREKIEELLVQETSPLTGQELSRILGVSRQVIVQDIALLRAVNKNILSTNKGYILDGKSRSARGLQRSFHLSHTSEEMEDEINTIIDLGGKILDVVVEHDVYGQIMADLIISNRHDAMEFLDKVKQGKSRPLKDLTNGVHYHTVEAQTKEILDSIEKALRLKGYLLGSSKE